MPRSLLMCVRNLPTFAPSALRRAWGLVDNRAALLRVGAPPALLRTVYLQPQMTATEPGRPAGPACWTPLGAQFMLADFGHSRLRGAGERPRICIAQDVGDTSLRQLRAT